MILRSLTLKNYRNYRSQNITFHPEFNIIYGDNAQGKTNLIEAIYLLCNFRPFKQLKNEELIGFELEGAGVKGEIEANSGLNEVHITIKKEGRHTRLNGKAVHSIGKHIGRFKVVLFLPSDIEIIKEGMQQRRKYLDSVISTIDQMYLKTLRDYHRNISQRNHILSDQKNISEFSLEIWDDKIAELGAVIIKKRLDIIEKFNKKLNEIYSENNYSDNDVRMEYEFSFEADKDIAGAIKKSLKKNLPVDRRRGHTTIGPHRDSISFYIGGLDTYKYASQGQSKNLVLALKASEIKLVSELTGVNPILLLDDITSELDMNRKDFLFKTLKEFPGQIFVTSTNKTEIPYRGKHRTFYVKSGLATLENPGNSE